MKTRMVEERIGENLGPIDWSYNFRQHFDNYCTSDENRDRYCAKAVEMLRQIAEPGEWQAWVNHSSWFVDVVFVGMYDGWPYWKPVPSFAVASPLGGVEWHPFSWLQEVRRKPTTTPTREE